MHDHITGLLSCPYTHTQTQTQTYIHMFSPSTPPVQPGPFLRKYTNTNTNTYVLPFYASGSTRSLPPKIHKHKHKHIYICSPLLRLRFNPVPSSETHIYHHTISICKICRKYHNFVSNSNKYLRN